MADDWKSWPSRQKIIQQIDEAIRQNPKGMKKTAQEVENNIFLSVPKKEEYFQYITKIIMHLKDQDPTPNRGTSSNLTAVLSGQPMATQQINQGATSGGQMTITSGNQMVHRAAGDQMPHQGVSNQMTHQSAGNQMTHQAASNRMGQMIQNNRAGPQMINVNAMNMGQDNNAMTHQNAQGQMVQVNTLQNQLNPTLSVQQNNMPMSAVNMMPQTRMHQTMTGMVNPSDWQTSKLRQQEVMVNVNQKHPGMGNVNQNINPQTGKMINLPVSVGSNDQLNQMNIGNQINRPGIMQTRTQSPNFQTFKVIPRQNVPVVTMQQQQQQQHVQHPGINFISPSPSSAVPSPVGPGMTMGRVMHQQGVPSPSAAMLNTPGQHAQQASPANAAMDDGGEYIEKVKELQHKYHDTLKEVAQRFAKSESEKARNVFNLLQVLENPQIRSSMETLKRCEEVLERIGNRKVNRDREADAPKKDCPFTFLSDAISASLKTGHGVAAIQRAFAPIAKTLFPSDIDPEYPKFNMADTLSGRNRETKVSDTIQGEIARLHQRFKVNIDRELSIGDELVLLCHLDDVNLPYVPPVSLVMPPDYPANVPKFNFPVECRLTQFLRTAKYIMECRLFYLPDSYTISMLLDAWELSVRQACDKNNYSEDNPTPPETTDPLGLGF